MVKFNYNNINVELDYSEKMLDSRDYPVIAKGFSFGNNYEIVEHNAQFNLIKRALKRRPNHMLSRIIAVKQNIENITWEGKPGFRFDLEGIAVYKRKELS